MDATGSTVFRAIRTARLWWALPESSAAIDAEPFPDSSTERRVRSWTLIALLAITYHGTQHLPWDYRWHAFTAMLGLLSAVLLWSIRGPRWSVLWAVCLWGAIEGAEVFVCQLLGAYTRAVTTKQFEGMCDVQTGFPFYTVGLLMMTVCATLWIERHGWTSRR